VEVGTPDLLNRRSLTIDIRIDLGLSNIVYERMRTAITRLKNDPVVQEEHPQFILQSTYLRSIILNSFSSSPTTAQTPAALQAPDEVRYLSHDTLDHASRLSSKHQGVFRDDMRISSWARRYARHNPIRVEGDPELPLNSTQIRAVAMMIGERISLVQGVSFETRCVLSFKRFLAASRYGKNQNYH